MCVGVHTAVSQAIDLDSFNQDIKEIEKEKQLKEIDSNGRFQLITGIAIQKLLWNYDASKPSSDSGGQELTINESSQNIGIVWSTKFIAFRPWGIIGRLGLFFPLSITESINPSITDKGAAVVQATEYVLKNVESQMKGFGIELLAGPNYELNQNNYTINIGGGLAWNSYTEDIGFSDRHVSMIGVGLDTDFQWHIKKYFGISIGIKGEYYIFTAINANNKINDYVLNTKYMTTIGSYIATAWYF